MKDSHKKKKEEEKEKGLDDLILWLNFSPTTLVVFNFLSQLCVRVLCFAPKL